MHGHINFFAWLILIKKSLLQDKDELYRAGLGEKITFEDATVSQEEFHENILDNYPRLREGGGFWFLKGKIIPP